MFNFEKYKKRMHRAVCRAKFIKQFKGRQVSSKNTLCFDVFIFIKIKGKWSTKQVFVYTLREISNQDIKNKKNKKNVNSVF